MRTTAMRKPSLWLGRRYLLTTALIATIGATGIVSCPESYARIGESYGAFKTKIAKTYTFKAEQKKDSVTHYMFVMVKDKTHEEASAGFNIGLTISVSGGKVVGQAMVIRLGDNATNGKKLAVAHCLDFMYEALGKPAPRNSTETEQEFQAFSSAVDQVYAGIPQSVRYPGFKAKITINKSPTGDLLLAATPENPITVPPAGASSTAGSSNNSKGAPSKKAK